MKLATDIISAILFIAVLALAPGLIHGSLENQRTKSEIAQINHVMYGIFSVDAWKSRISEILLAEIGNLDLKTTAAELKGTIEKEMAVAIDQLEKQIKQSNEGTFEGRIKQALIDAFVNVKTIKKGVPQYTDAIIAQLGNSETQSTVKSLAMRKLRRYLNKSFTEENRGPVKTILKQTSTDSIPAATQKLQGEIASRQTSLEWRGYAIILFSALLFAWAAIARNRTRFTISLLFSTLVVLLVIGVSIPMIDLEAKISELSFVLLGHKVSFENQILYFQSKSVVDVFWLMITNPELKMKAVGILMVTFSIFFPILKMAASLTYYFSKRLRSSRAVCFLAFKIGKWSMADVMVVAILMAYIGFNGIFDAQFSKMKSAVPGDVNLFTTNGTALQMGYFVFLAYVVLAMVLSGYVHASAPPNEKAA